MNYTIIAEKAKELEQKLSNAYPKINWDSTELLSELTCPQCHGRLRLIDGKYGPFFGCSNYPDCRYTKGVKKWNG